MKRILLIICCIVSAPGYAQQPQKVNAFHVVDSGTGKPVPYTTIIILRAKLAIATEDNGVFHIPGNLAVMRDTIALNAQTYAPLKLPLNKLATMDTIRLNKIAVKTQEAGSKFSKKLILNDHLAGDVGLYAGVATEDAPFNYLQIAQCFVTNTSNNRLVSVTINKTRDWMLTKFRVRIYDIDAATGGPGADLCDRIIDIDNEDDVNDYLNRTGRYNTFDESKSAIIDLRKYNIIIPNRKFYVAVEWLRDFFNATKVPVYNKVTNKVDTAIVFRPYIGISPVKGNQLNIWVMELDGKWKTYNHFYPLGTDLAIKSTVEY
jgi:hypothetical protein